MCVVSGVFARRDRLSTSFPNSGLETPIPEALLRHASSDQRGSGTSGRRVTRLEAGHEGLGSGGPMARAVSLLLVVLFCGAATADETKWGTVTGRIVFGGEAPKPEVLDIERDAEVCGKAGLVDESLVVNDTSRGIQNVAIWLDEKSPQVHPDLTTAPTEPAAIDNKDCRFVPRMQVLRTGQTLRITNADPVAHNAAIYARRNTPSNVVVSMNQVEEKVFPKPETLPARVDCSIHAWMKGWLIITDSPYAAVTDADGNFELKNVAAGERKIRVWHERPGFVTTVHHNGEAVALEKGVWNLTVPPDGVLDLGEITVSAETLQQKK